MTDLQTMIVMLSKSNETFSKYKSGDDWKITFSTREVYILFDKDGNFKYISRAF